MTTTKVDSRNDVVLTHANANTVGKFGKVRRCQLDSAQSDVHDGQGCDVTHDGNAVNVSYLRDQRVDDKSGDEEDGRDEEEVGHDLCGPRFFRRRRHTRKSKERLLKIKEIETKADIIGYWFALTKWSLSCIMLSTQYSVMCLSSSGQPGTIIRPSERMKKLSSSFSSGKKGVISPGH